MPMVYAIHAPEDAKLAAVTAEMQIMGPPTIRVVDCGGYYMALEGSHRLAAADALDLTPEFDVIDQEDEINIESFDWFEPQNWDGTTYLAGEVAGELFSTDAADYRFD